MSRGAIRLTSDEREQAAGFARTAGLIASRVAFASNMNRVRDDLRSEAFEALSRASATYDPEHPSKCSFTTYAWRRVTGAVLDAVRKEATRVSLETSLDAAEEIAAGGDPATDAGIIAQIDAGTAVIMAAFAASCVARELHTNGEATLLERETRAEVERALAALPDIDRRLFELRHRDGARWEEVVPLVGMSERNARDRCKEIREKLRRILVGRAEIGR
jgi:RNA polymerase sigma factor (sigma-70 family)